MDQTKRLLKALAPKPANLQGDTFQLPNLGGVNDFLNQGIKGTKELDFPRFKMSTGATNGYVLTCDANGVGTWQEAPSYWWLDTTTANFDACVKSASSGNYEIETSTDNLDITDGQFELSNKYSDRFTFNDADGTTWKWTDIYLSGASGGSADIDTTVSGQAYSEIKSAVEKTEYSLRLNDVVLSGSFDLRVDFDNLVIPNSNLGIVGLLISTTPDALTRHAGAMRMYYSILGGQIYYGATNADAQAGWASSSDTSGKFRVTREVHGVDDATFTTYYWNGSSWVQLNTRRYTQDWADDDYYVFLGLHTDGVRPDIEVSFDNFHVYSGTLVNAGEDPYRSTGNITSKLYTIPYNSKLNEMTITLANASATYYVDKVEILSSADAVLATSNTNITANGANVVGDWDNALSTITQDFKYKIYLAGDGAGSCSVTDVKISFKK